MSFFSKHLTLERPRYLYIVAAILDVLSLGVVVNEMAVESFLNAQHEGEVTSGRMSTLVLIFFVLAATNAASFLATFARGTRASKAAAAVAVLLSIVALVVVGVVDSKCRASMVAREASGHAAGGDPEDAVCLRRNASLILLYVLRCGVAIAAALYAVMRTAAAATTAGVWARAAADAAATSGGCGEGVAGRWFTNRRSKAVFVLYLVIDIVALLTVVELVAHLERARRDELPKAPTDFAQFWLFILTLVLALYVPLSTFAKNTLFAQITASIAVVGSFAALLATAVDAARAAELFRVAYGRSADDPGRLPTPAQVEEGRYAAGTYIIAASLLLLFCVRILVAAFDVFRHVAPARFDRVMRAAVIDFASPDDEAAGVPAAFSIASVASAPSPGALDSPSPAIESGGGGGGGGGATTSAGGGCLARFTKRRPKAAWLVCVTLDLVVFCDLMQTMAGVALLRSIGYAAAGSGASVVFFFGLLVAALGTWLAVFADSDLAARAGGIVASALSVVLAVFAFVQARGVACPVQGPCYGAESEYAWFTQVGLFLVVRVIATSFIVASLFSSGVAQIAATDHRLWQELNDSDSN